MNYASTSADIQLQTALDTFRREKTHQIYGRAHLKNLGPGSIMANNVLKRIVDCARVRKLPTLGALYRETKWSRAADLGEQVLEVVGKYVFTHILYYSRYLHWFSKQDLSAVGRACRAAKWRPDGRCVYTVGRQRSLVRALCARCRGQTRCRPKEMRCVRGCGSHQ